jgi:hypothetical protein
MFERLKSKDYAVRFVGDHVQQNAGQPFFMLGTMGQPHSCCSVAVEPAVWQRRLAVGSLHPRIALLRGIWTLLE